MTLNEYQRRAAMTCLPQCAKLNYMTLGACGEVGEIANKVKKIIRDKGGEMSGEDRLELAKEIGDALWYLSGLANVIGVSLDCVGEMNLEKLASRKQREQITGSGDNR